MCCSEDEALILLIGLSPTLQKVLMGRQSHKLEGPDFALSYPYVSSVTATALHRAERGPGFCSFTWSFIHLFSVFKQASLCNRNTTDICKW